jgi:delta24-sterol reductase
MEQLSNSGSHAPTFIDGVGLGPTSSIAVVGEPAPLLPPGARLQTLRASRLDPWFFWRIADIARRSPTVTSSQYRAAGPSVLEERPDLIAHEEYIPIEDFLFRFDRGAFWMARHGLNLFWGNAAWNPDTSACAGPSWWIRGKYAWLATTRRLYDMLHTIKDELLARTYIIQDFIMPGKVQAAALVELTSAPHVDIWPLWLCPVRMVQDRAPTNSGFGFPVQATKQGDLWFNVGVYGPPARGKPFDPVSLNQEIENKASALGGRKMLYAQSYYTQKSFWELFSKDTYTKLRKAYAHGDEIFPDIATKLLMAPAKLEKFSGVKSVTLISALGPLLAWYMSIWGELFIPRAFHESLGIRYTGMKQFTLTGDAPVPIGESRRYVRSSNASGSTHGSSKSWLCSRRTRTVPRETH